MAMGKCPIRHLCVVQPVHPSLGIFFEPLQFLSFLFLPQTTRNPLRLPDIYLEAESSFTHSELSGRSKPDLHRGGLLSCCPIGFLILLYLLLKHVQLAGSPNTFDSQEIPR